MPFPMRWLSTTVPSGNVVTLSSPGSSALAGAAGSFAVASSKRLDCRLSSTPEIAAAIIQVKQGETLTEAEVEDYCLDLPRYKRPRRIIFAEVPRNPTGKIEKPKLRRIYCGESLVAQQIK